MKTRKHFVLIFAIFFLTATSQFIAQTAEPVAPVKILENNGSVPFVDGETTIAEIKIVGLDSDIEEENGPAGRSLRESDFNRVLRENRAEIHAEDRFSGADVSRSVKLLRDFAASNGYRRAEVEALGEMLADNRMRLVFSVRRGTPVFVSEIRFDGNLKFTDAELVGMMTECLGDRRVFDARHYEYCAQKNVRGFLFSKGFFQAKITSITPHAVSDSLIFVEISVEEGDRFVYGKLEIEGNTVFSRNQMLEMFGQKTGDVADGKHLQDFAFQRLKNAYLDKGYVLYGAELIPVFIEPQTKGMDGTVDIKIIIWEGRQFKTGDISFAGIEGDAENRLRELIPLKPGEVFNLSKFEEGIGKINELREFYPIDFDADVEIRTFDNAEGLIIIIRIDTMTVYERDKYYRILPDGRP